MSQHTCSFNESSRQHHAAAYNQGWHDGYQAAHDSYQEHEARIYAVAFASGFKAGNHAANQFTTKQGWAE